jgi:SAM-dependent methyltransferase
MTSYVFDNAWQRARERLTALEAWLDPGTVRYLEALRVDAGWHCLDVGAGGGSIAAWLGARVGAGGRVVATDIDPRFLAGLEATNVEVRQHDVLRDDLEVGAFDLVHARCLLEHLPDPDQALARLVAALRPGGWLLVEDIDFVSFVPGSGMSEADAALFARCWAASRAAGESRGSSADYGRRLYGAVAARGLSDLGAEGRVTIARGGSPAAEMWRLTVEQMRGAIVGPDRLSEPELERYFALLQDPGATWMMPTIVAAWGRRPQG